MSTCATHLRLPAIDSPYDSKSFVVRNFFTKFILISLFIDPREDSDIDISIQPDVSGLFELRIEKRSK